jgi:hypothetical protein
MGHRPHAGLLIFTGAMLFAGGLIASCLPDTSAPTLQPRATATSRTSLSVAELPTTTPVLAPFTDQACLDCHTDQETLVLLAMEQEAPEALSSGPG